MAMDVTIFMAMDVTMDGNWAVSWPWMIGTRYTYVSFATTLNTRAQLFKTNDIVS